MKMKAPQFLLLVAATAAVGAFLVPHQTTRTIDLSQFSYMGRGVPGNAYLDRQAAAGGDYLADIAVGGGGLHRWPQNKFPLKVFIADGRMVPGYRPEFKQIMQQAFQDWQQNTHGLVSWQQVSDPRQADIVTLWTSDVTARQGGVEAGNTETMTAVDPYSHNGTIMAAKISILTALGGRSFPIDEMRKTTLHEVGHSLGLEGHSQTRSDIMYAAVNPAQTPYLRDRDVNTLSRLYSGVDPVPSPAVAGLPRSLFGGFGNSNNYYNSPSPVGAGFSNTAWQLGRQYLRDRFGL
jgi:predicted Zn-dependent protease